MKKLSVRELTVTGMLVAVSWVLYMLGFKLPFIPSHLSMDFSELPAVIASLAIGPTAGVFVCLIKNLLHLLVSRSMWIGELSNFILGVAFVVPVGLIYRRKKTKNNAILALAIGSVVMPVVGVFSNYFLIYPLYDKIVMPMEAIMKMYTVILPSADTLIEGLLIFNVPFTFFKALVSSVVTLLIYKPLSKIIKNTK